MIETLLFLIIGGFSIIFARSKEYLKLAAFLSFSLGIVLLVFVAYVPDNELEEAEVNQQTGNTEEAQ